MEDVLQLLERVDILLPSLNDSQALPCEIPPEGCLEGVFARCPNRVMLKMGRSGEPFQHRGIFRQPAFPALPLNTTGACHCFDAGMMVGVLKDWDLLTTLRLADALAALVISRPREKRYLLLEEVEEYLDKWRQKGQAWGRNRRINY